MSETMAGTVVAETVATPAAAAKPRTRIEDNPNAVLNLGADRLRPVLDRLVSEGSTTKEQAELVWWFFCRCRAEGWSTQKCAREIGVEKSTIYRVFTGSYPAGLGAIAQRIANYRRVIEERAGLNQDHYVQTSIARKVEQVCHAAWLSQSVAMVWGESQTGKTFALQHYAATHNHGTTKYVRIPAAATKTIAAQEIARACYVSAEGGWHTVRDRVVRAVGADNLMIVDEFHELFCTTNRQNAAAIMEFLRELHDRSGCGLVLCATNIGRDEMETGRQAPVLRQLSMRGVVKLQLPDRAPMEDFWLLAGAYGLERTSDPAITELVRGIRQRSGLGPFSDYLKMGARLAHTRGTAYDWETFATAHDALASLSKK